MVGQSVVQEQRVEQVGPEEPEVVVCNDHSCQGDRGHYHLILMDNEENREIDIITSTSFVSSAHAS